MKKILLSCAVLALTVSVFAADVLRYPSSQQPVINSAATTATNLTFGANTNGIWPCYIPASTAVTNVTAVDVSNGKVATIQFTAAASQTNGGIVLLSIGRSVQGLYPTNSSGGGAGIEWVGVITNTLPANTATTANTVCYTISEQQPATALNGTPLALGANTRIYLGTITTPANVTLTNYAVYVNVK